MFRGAGTTRRRAVAAWAIVIGLGTTAVASCSVALDFESLSGGARDDAALDVASEVGDVGGDVRGVADAADAADVTDTGAVTDAPPRDADASPPPPFCASLAPAPLFCDDFDTAAISAIWDDTRATNGTVDQTSTTFTSAPRSLRIETKALVPGDNVDVHVRKAFAQFTGKPIHASYALDLRVDLLDKAGAETILASLQFSSAVPGEYYELQLTGRVNASNPNAVTLTFAEVESGIDGGPSLYDARELSAALPVGQWRRVKFDLVVTDYSSPPGANTVKVSLDGALQVQKSLKFPMQNGPPKLEIGTSYVSEPSAPWTFFADNVTMDMKTP